MSEHFGDTTYEWLLYGDDDTVRWGARHPRLRLLGVQHLQGAVALRVVTVGAHQGPLCPALTLPNPLRLPAGVVHG